MSVINRVLKDLDRQGATPAPLAGVLAVQSSLAPARRRWPWAVLLVAGLATAWGFWPAAEAPPPAAPEAVPRLRLSETLSEAPAPGPAPPGASGDSAAVVGPPGGSIRGAGGEGAAVAMSARPEPTKPSIARLQPQREFQPSSTVPEGEGRTAPYPVKLDTSLPEPRPPRVVKETRPPTPREQADQAWRQAARLIEQGRGRDAWEGLEAALRLDPGHVPARQSLIALSLEEGELARGEALLRDGLQLHANDAWYNRALGQLYLQRGETAQAAAILKAGLGKGVDAGYWGLYAGVLGKAGRHEEAVQAYREAVRLNPEHAAWWIGLAVSLERIGSRADAAAAYQRALQTKLSPELREFAAKKAAELGP